MQVQIMIRVLVYKLIHWVCRPSELPIYTPDPVTRTIQQTDQDQAPNFIENSVKSVRQTLGKFTDEFVAYEKVAKQSLSESRENVECKLYLL